jgi:NAD(P)H-hydrate epimerase
MCIRAALHSGAGLVTGFVPETLAPAFAAVAPEAMWVDWPETPDGSLALEGLGLLRARIERADAIVLGPGLGMERETQMLAAEIVKLVDRPVVLDADALQPAVLKAAAGKPVVCLPHAGEFKRLAGGQEAEPATLRALARETGATVVLKGPVTRIAGGAASVTRIDGAGPVRRISSDESPLERGGREAGVCIYHSFFGGPVLARGGSGDLLAGLVGGLLAQAPGDPLLAACRGVVWHGLAADLLARDRGQVAVQVTQLLDYLPAALRTAVGRE